METLHSSMHTVYCAAKRTVERASKCSVCDGTRIYLITLKEDQTSELQEGETYIINNATVKEDHPVSEMILGNEAEVFRTAPLQLDENLIYKAKESISPSSERAALNDPGLYLKKGYITLTGEVVSLSAVWRIEGDIPVRDVVIEEAGVKVTVSLQKEAATEPIEKGQIIEITHVKVGKNMLCGKKLKSSDFTVVSETEGSHIKVVGCVTKDSNKVLLIDDEEKLSVPFSVWCGDADQLLQTLPVELKITRRGQKVTKVKKANSEKSSMHRVYCVAKRTVKRASKYDVSGDSVRVNKTENVALCSVCDGTRIFLITLKKDKISKLQEGETYIIENATVKEEHPVLEMILENKTGVFRTAPLQLDENLIYKAKESINPSSERAALNDSGLYLKQGYITLTGEVVSLSAPQWIEGDIPVPVRDVEIEEAGVTVTLSLQKEAATVPLERGQMINITHIKVEKNNTQEKKLTSSDYTVIFGSEGSHINVVGFSTKDSNKVLLTDDRQEPHVPFSVWRGDADQLLHKIPAQLSVTRRGQEVMQVEKPNCEKMETFCSSVRRVRCVAKRTVKRASKYDVSGDSVTISETEIVALCSVCDGDQIYLITLKEDQISKLQEGENYIINNATVKEDHPVSEMILGNVTRVFRRDPLQLDDNLICRAKEIINPSSERAALNDPGLYLKEGYITLIGKVVLLSAPRWIEKDIPVRYIVMEEAGVKVTVSFQKQAATEPLKKGQMIKITHLKVGKNMLCGKKITSSDFTVVSVQQESTDEERRSLLKHEGFAASDDSNFLLTRRDQEVMDVEVFKF